MMKKHHMDQVNPSHIQNEKILYHGTSADTLKDIETSGFNRSYAGKNGEVVYFIVTLLSGIWFKYGISFDIFLPVFYAAILR